MISIKQINEKDIDLCYELDSSTISFWTKQQWAGELKKRRYKSLSIIPFKFSCRDMCFSCGS